MAPIKISSSQGRFRFPGFASWLLGCLIVLPYVSYAGLIGAAALVLSTCYRYASGVCQLLHRSGWVAFAAGMTLTVAVAQFPGESALQLANFLPFIAFLGVVAFMLPRLSQPFLALDQWASALLAASIPISLRAAVEFVLNEPTTVQRFTGLWYLNWLYSQEYYGHRADSVFGHPNVLASYLVMMFGLGLGLSLKFIINPSLVNPKRLSWWRSPRWIYAATLLAPIGILGSGSRNGALVAIIQLLIWSLLIGRNQRVLIVGAAGVGTVFLSTFFWGIGGRSFAEAFTTINLRVEVWRLAVDMISQHPWLGTGLGSYKLLYVPYAVTPYDSVEHAHNLWLMLAAELGIPMMLGITFVVGWCCWRCVVALVTHPFSREQRCIAAGYLLAFAGCSLFALFDLTFYDARANLLGWLLLAALQAVPKLSSNA